MIEVVIDICAIVFTFTGTCIFIWGLWWGNEEQSFRRVVVGLLYMIYGHVL